MFGGSASGLNLGCTPQANFMCVCSLYMIAHGSVPQQHNVMCLQYDAHFEISLQNIVVYTSDELEHSRSELKRSRSELERTMSELEDTKSELDLSRSEGMATQLKLKSKEEELSDVQEQYLEMRVKEFEKIIKVSLYKKLVFFLSCEHTVLILSLCHFMSDVVNSSKSSYICIRNYVQDKEL